MDAVYMLIRDFFLNVFILYLIFHTACCVLLLYSSSGRRRKRDRGGGGGGGGRMDRRRASVFLGFVFISVRYVYTIDERMKRFVGNVGIRMYLWFDCGYARIRIE
jgi:hypothetical protein